MLRYQITRLFLLKSMGEGEKLKDILYAVLLVTSLPCFAMEGFNDAHGQAMRELATKTQSEKDAVIVALLEKKRTEIAERIQKKLADAKQKAQIRNSENVSK